MKPESPTAVFGQDPLGIQSLVALSRHHGKLALLAATFIACLSSCASTTHDPPPPGHAQIDATPDPDRRDRIDGIQLISVNGIPTRGTKTALTPGRNTV